MQDPILADAFMDRLEHNAYKVELRGEFMRKKPTVLDRELEPVTDFINQIEPTKRITTLRIIHD
jgi:hypothetical protein